MGGADAIRSLLKSRIEKRPFSLISAQLPDSNSDCKHQYFNNI
jgi:hypothetical protein